MPLPPKIWAVLPAFNEEGNLGPLLGGIGAVLEAMGRPFEIVVIDDGSSDRTRDVVLAHRMTLPVRLQSHLTNEGLGKTIGDGLFLASGRAAPEDAIVTLDADNTHPPHFIPALVQALEEADVAIASRFQKDSRVLGLAPYRRLISFGGNWLLRLIFPVAGVRDYTCGFRAYRASKLQDAFTDYGRAFVDEPGFPSTLDILLKLRAKGLTFAEIPFILRYDYKVGRSKMRLGPTLSATLALLFRRRLYGAR